MPFYIFVCRVCFQVVFWDVLDDFYFLYALETSTEKARKVFANLENVGHVM